MNIILVSATILELTPTLTFLEKNAKQVSFSEYQFMGHSIFPYVTGVGSPMTSFALGRNIQMEKMQFLIHAGICGSYHNDLALGELVEVTKERWGDLGAETINANLIDVFELGLCNPNQAPFTNGWIEKNNQKFSTDLRNCSGLTMNKSSGNQVNITNIHNKYPADVESMEGAAVFYACRMMHIPFVSIRAVSNLVEPRNKENWKIDLAVERLNAYIIKYLSSLN